VTNLPHAEVLREVFARMEELLNAYAQGSPRTDGHSNIVAAQSMFK
jgi:hypothetical protein